MLTKEQKDRWLKDLRSGEFEQGTHCYYDPDTGCYCAFGVLNMQGGHSGMAYHSKMPIPPEGIMPEGYELLSDKFHESEAGGRQWGVITEMNDYGRKSFSEIADWIESNVTIREEVT